MAGTIWGIQGLFGAQKNAISDLLNGDDCTLEKLLDEDELLQELNTSNEDLAEFLAVPKTLRKIIEYAISDSMPVDDTPVAEETETAAAASKEKDTSDDAATEVAVVGDGGATESSMTDTATEKIEESPETETAPETEETFTPVKVDTIDTAASDDADDGRESSAIVSHDDFLRYSRRCTEIFCCDVEPIMEQIFKTELGFFELLLKVLDRPSPLNSRVAANFRKIIEAITRSNPQEFMSLLNSRTETLPKQFLSHTDSYSVMGMYRGLLMLPHDFQEGGMVHSPFGEPTCEEPAPLADSTVWGNRSFFVTQLVEALGDESRLEDTIENRAAHKNIASVLVGVFQRANRLKYLDEATSNKLLHIAFDSPSRTCREEALEILVRIFSLDSSAGSSQHLCVQQFVKLGDKLVKLLDVKGKAQVTRTGNTGHQIPVLGAERLRVAQVVCKALATGFKDVAEELASSGVLARCCDLFLHFEWHSLLHSAVGPAINDLISQPNEIVEEALFKTYPLLTKFLDAYAEATDVAHGKRLEPANIGWMHHIFNQIVQISEASPESIIATVCAESQRWKEFVENQLQQANEKDETMLGGAGRSMMEEYEPEGPDSTATFDDDSDSDSDDEDPNMLARYGLVVNPSATDNYDDDDDDDWDGIGHHELEQPDAKDVPAAVELSTSAANDDPKTGDSDVSLGAANDLPSNDGEDWNPVFEDEVDHFA